MKTKRTHKYPATRAPALRRKASGSGPLLEIRTARGESQVLIAAMLGIQRPTVARAEREGRAPTDREARHILLNMALNIPESMRSSELDAWIAGQQAEFEARPLGGKFL